MITFIIAASLCSCATIFLGILFHYTKNKPTGLQTLPDISLCDAILTVEAFLFTFVGIIIVHDFVGPIEESYAFYPVLAIIAFERSSLIHSITYQTLLYLCIYHGNVVWDWNENMVSLVTRVTNIVFTLTAVLIDIQVYEAGTGSLLAFLTTGSDEERRTKYGLAGLTLTTVWLLLTISFQIRLEIDAYKSSEQYSDSGLKKLKALFASNKIYPVVNSEVDGFLQIKTMRRATVGIFSSTLIFGTFVTLNSLFPDDVPGAIKIILILITISTVIWPAIWISRSPKIFNHARRMFRIIA